jgi:acyl-coenzyme A thioesterase PaaI-like protein
VVERKITSVQNVSRMCMVCGRDNPWSLKARFFELEGNELLGVFAMQDIHQSYPGRVHGGVVTAMLDETIGRAVSLDDPSVFGVTVEIRVKFRKPVPIDGELHAIARLTTPPGRLYEGTGEIVLDDGTVVAEAWGRYMRMPIEKIADGDFSSEWFADDRPRPDEVELPA